MVTRFNPQIDTPYCLHDMLVSKITYKNKTVYLEFSQGYIRTKGPRTQVNGTVKIEKVDMDFSCVLLLSKMGKYGSFTGRKLSLHDFIEQYEEGSFEIVDELYGYHQVEYIGYLHFPDKAYVTQTSLSMYYDGDIVYETEES